MIRDPSDGSVKAPDIRPKPAQKELTNDASGLPFGSTKPETIARLEKSREWLKSYRRGQE